MESQIPGQITASAPAGARNLPDGVADQIQHLAKRVYRALGLSGYARIDMRMDKDGNVTRPEANPNPQIASGEDFADSAEKADLAYKDLLQELLQVGLRWRPQKPRSGMNGLAAAFSLRSVPQRTARTLWSFTAAALPSGPFDHPRAAAETSPQLRSRFAPVLDVRHAVRLGLSLKPLNMINALSGG